MTSTEACGDLTPGVATGIIFVPGQILRFALHSQILTFYS